MQVAAKNLDFSSRNEAKIDLLRADFELKNHVLSFFFWWENRLLLARASIGQSSRIGGGPGDVATDDN